MNAITQGQLDVPIPKVGRDEIGAMTRALGMLRDSLIERDRLERERQRAEGEARRAQVQLIEAIEAISEGFSLYDSEDKLVVCNSHYKELFPGHRDTMVPGTPFERIVRNRHRPRPDRRCRARCRDLARPAHRTPPQSIRAAHPASLGRALGSGQRTFDGERRRRCNVHRHH